MDVRNERDPGGNQPAAHAVVISPGGVTELFLMPAAAWMPVLDMACTFSRQRLLGRGVY
jgi:hypothetical protein